MNFIRTLDSGKDKHIHGFILVKPLLLKIYSFLKNKFLPTTGFKGWVGQQLHELNIPFVSNFLRGDFLCTVNLSFANSICL